MKKYFEYFVKKTAVRVVVLIVLILVACAVFLSVLSARDMKRIINEDFNSQQLELARHAAGVLTENFRILKRELMTLSLSPSIQYIEEVSWANRMKISFSTVMDYGVSRILLINTDGTRVYSNNYNGTGVAEDKAYGHEDFFLWCKRIENKNKIYMSDLQKGIAGDSEPGFFKLMAIPVYQVSVDEAHPLSTQQFSGVLAFILDTTIFTKRVVGFIRSGKTGYAWIINEKGNFLYHLKKDFIGQNAFKVRKFKYPHISFSKINLLQKTKMLEGNEGTSWYISGWHRGEIGSMKKLIAYSPVQIGAANAKKTWSVAVVAPISEVADAIHNVYVRQSLIQGALIVTVVIVLIFFIIIERIWLRTLAHMVEEKTSNLEQYARRLKRSEERYRSLIESADDMIYTVDKDCNILSVNQYYERLTGLFADKVVGKYMMDIFEYRNPKDVYRIVERVLAESVTISRDEQARIEGREYWLDTKYKPFLTGGDQTSSVLVISRDITDHKSLETQLFHTEKLASLGSLSAGVAHEINNPITIILGFTEMLLERLPKDTKDYEILETIERQGNNCKKIIENLLAFARIPQKITKETDVVDDLQKVVNVVMNTLVNKKIDLKTDIEEVLPMVKGDSQQIEQVFLNIVNNAVAAMDAGGILTISAYHSDDMVSISFTDTGHGIYPENMEKIFEPFFTTKKVGEGTGLGLSVSYGIVKKFGGDIMLRSQTCEGGKKPGTTFTVLIPVAR